MKRFEAGKTYSTRSACDHESIFSYEIIKRTEKTVTIKAVVGGEIVRRKITVWNGAETIQPEGRYSMAPILSAEREAKP